MVSSKGGKKGFVYKNRHSAYKALRRKGKTKKEAAMIANAGHTKTGRSRMAKKAARTRKRRKK